MGENFTPSVASRQYVRQLAAHAPLRIPGPVCFNTDAQEWQGMNGHRLHYSPTAGGDNTIFNRIKSGFPSAVIVNFETDGASTPVPLMALGVTVRESADGGTVVRYGLIKDLVEGSIAVTDKPTIAIGLASDGRSAWIDFTVDYGDDNPEDGFEKKALFIDLWNEACGDYGAYNAETGYFELNGLTDITYNEALKIYQVSQPTIRGAEINYWHTYPKVRTFLPIKTGGGKEFYFSLGICESLEIYRIISGYGEKSNFTVFDISGCINLRKILGTVILHKDSRGSFYRCYKLEYLMLAELSQSIIFKDSPLLSLESFQYMVANAANTTAITITVHPDVYAKLTGDTTNDAYNNLTEKQKAAWTQLITDAAAKNITFVTV